MSTATAQVHFHPFQEAGLGEAPFRLVAVLSFPSKALCEANPNAYNHAAGEVSQQARALGVDLGSCQFCGMLLTNNFVIRDRYGKHVVVGCDCVAKTGDSQLMSAADREQKRHEKKLRDAAAIRKREAANAAREARLATEREQNGGLTDYELREQQARDEQARKAEAIRAENAWLLEVLEQVQTDGEFLPSIIRDLSNFTRAADLSPRALDILASIYAKAVSGKRRGAEYDAAWERFFEKAGA